jgi:hypothetical protein
MSRINPAGRLDGFPSTNHGAMEGVGAQLWTGDLAPGSVGSMGYFNARFYWAF